jgi:cell division protein FtsW (lipid II flippase)
LLPSSSRSGPSPFALASLLAVAAGCLTAAASGLPPGVWGRNAAAWVLGALLALLLARRNLSRLLLCVAPLALLLTLASPGQSGVYRWLTLGPVTGNAAFLFLPAATVALATAARSGSLWPWSVAFVIELALCLQPDASQATAFAVAAVLILLLTPTSRRLRLPAILLLSAAAGLSWTRHDPLAPVPAVEGILALAWAVSPGLAAVCVTTLVAVSATPLAFLRTARSPALALSVYFSVCVLMPLCGAYPVPLVGMGLSPIIGFWAGIGVLMAVTEL